MRSLFKWMNEANDFLKDQEPAAGDPETMEAQLEQSEVSWVIHLASHRSTVPKSYQHLISTYHTHVLSSIDQVTLGRQMAVLSWRHFCLACKMSFDLNRSPRLRKVVSKCSWGCRSIDLILFFLAVKISKAYHWQLRSKTGMTFSGF